MLPNRNRYVILLLWKLLVTDTCGTNIIVRFREVSAV